MGHPGGSSNTNSPQCPPRTPNQHQTPSGSQSCPPQGNIGCPPQGGMVCQLQPPVCPPQGGMVCQLQPPVCPPQGGMVCQPQPPVCPPQGGMVCQPLPPVCPPQGGMVCQPQPPVCPPQGGMVCQPQPPVCPPQGGMVCQPQPPVCPPQGGMVCQPQPPVCPPQGGMVCQPQPPVCPPFVCPPPPGCPPFVCPPPPGCPPFVCPPPPVCPPFVCPPPPGCPPFVCPPPPIVCPPCPPCIVFPPCPPSQPPNDGPPHPPQPDCDDKSDHQRVITITCTPKPPVQPSHTNVVRPVVVNIQLVINFGLQTMLKNRHNQYIKIIMAIENLKNNPEKETVITARDVVDTYSRQIPQLKLIWEQLRDYYRHLLRDCNDPYNPIPSLCGLTFSPMISQGAFRDRLIAVLYLCREALFLTNVDFNGTRQFITFIETKVMSNPQAFEEYCEIEIFETNLSKGNELIRMFTEKQLLMNLFLKEWGKGGADLDQPDCPPTYATLPLTLPGQKGSSPRGFSKMGNTSNNVEDMVSRFNEIEDCAYKEVNKSRGQRENMNQSMNAVQGF